MASNLFPSIFNRNPLFRVPRGLTYDLEQLVEQLVPESSEQGLTIYEDKNNRIVVEAAMPGLTPEEIEVHLDKGVLWIKGQKKEEESDKDKKFHRRSVRSFFYSVVLPEQIDDKQEPQTSYKEGILQITFQKAKSSEAKRITVKR
ncbi:Hsp20/alpha crystallin family protein [Parachlamydia sp. AcF125]|uniref:Hsp20/alpha crystallin family protein n=1 Tax=Parachlamydia sp. AcF125 TaxID=2795736 RepID=UPI001BC99167|nr:Hsp20/alpha crystallin family protein [Parachlamydia sp. AcF125]MBS4168160.1 Acid shock protein [Parachlamydia sp. AcF125]